MFLIALAGGFATERASISELLVASGKGQMQAFIQMTPSTDFAQRRVQILREALDRPTDETAAYSNAGLIITHCLTEEEAQEVRLRGGAIWHMYSRPSASVVIRRGDSIVAEEGGEPRHVLEPLEALSELMLARLSSPGAKQARALIAELAGRG